MASSEVEIASAALVHLGRDSITTFDDTTRTNARLLKSRYPRLRNKLLRTYPWNFAMRFASLPGEALETPVFGYSHKCILPAGGALPYCEKLWKVEPDIKRQVVGREVYIAATPPISISYVARIEDGSQFDPIFAEMLAIDIALSLINKLGTDEIKRRRRDLRSERKELRRDARLADAMENSPPKTEDRGSWAAARRPR
ncbi:hypothetical protein [uncultured Ruegeria sp.]|uniref:hypothetical protein n=1 Tax=uncultured Ruegeria sp. TaxID=259304 RepID=UPI002628E649|nr:hypothetical protein [uncultured Ruegeria sp.]